MWQKEKDEVLKKRKRDRPFDRGYTFLRALLVNPPHVAAVLHTLRGVALADVSDRPRRTERLALSYQLEAIHASAARLAATSWNGRLEVERRTRAASVGTGDAEVEREDEVRVHYWRSVAVPVLRCPSMSLDTGRLRSVLRCPRIDALCFAQTARLSSTTIRDSNRGQTRSTYSNTYSVFLERTSCLSFFLDQSAAGKTTRTGRHHRLFPATDLTRCTVGTHPNRELTGAVT